MSEQIEKKVELNQITHSVRAAQAVLQYGVGAMVDFPDQTLVTTAPEYWGESTKIYDDRFAKALGVDYFAVPTKIAYSRFPEWYLCPKCRNFQPITKWVKDYNRKSNNRKLKNNEYMTRNLCCLKCNLDLVVARIVTVCEQGHINDFPWVKWVHIKGKKPICENPSLKLKTGASGSEGLEGIYIKCSCGAFATLKDSFDIGELERLDKDTDSPIFRCEGNHPHKHQKENCPNYPRTVQRGSSSVYFPVVYSSLVIPPYADKLNSKIEKSKAFSDCITIIEDEDPEDKTNKIKKNLSKWADKIASEIGVSRNDIERILTRKWLESGKAESDIASVKYRAEEYEALNGEVSAPSGYTGDFFREGLSGSEFSIPHIDSVSLIDKVRVVNTLIGFSRINPVNGKNDKGFVNVKESNTPWYPAYEVRGEGIFIEFNQTEIDIWVSNNPQVVERIKILDRNYCDSFAGRSTPREITPKFVLLHTVAHLLIRQLSFECGYSVASLSERIYCAEKVDGKSMSGVFIYTASGDSEGTLGGLVRQGKPDAFPQIFRKAILNAQTCSNDPICILSRGQGRESLNLAACHACGLLPETCCEERNMFLDRGLIVGTFEDKKIGFWSELFTNQ